MALVLVEFPCSFNGVTSETMRVGEVRDFGSMTAGLVGMGWISDDEAPVAAIELVVEPVIEPVIEPAPQTPTPLPAPLSGRGGRKGR